MAPIKAAVVLLAATATADVYMHNPRGSNDRNCERNVNRNNGNRLFDSQNNAKGGYACPRAVGDESRQNEAGEAIFNGFTQNKKMYFYEGSILPIEWTNQHGCGQNSKTNCEIVLQYMCEDTGDPFVDDFWPYTSSKNDGTRGQAFRAGANVASPRDGIPDDDDDAATDTIPDTADAATPDTEADRRYGMHEPFSSYELCQRTERNEGLYTADQHVRRNDMRGTRQNPNGDRRGLECPEERDYYPHWHPSPWVDIAVLTNDAGDEPCAELPCDSNRCTYYLENSFNTHNKSYCDVAHDGTQSFEDKANSQAWQQRSWYNNREACEANGFTWHSVSLSDVLDGLKPPICAKTQFARVNQLGNAVDTAVSSTNGGDDDGAPQGVNANRFLWTVPSIPTPKKENYVEGDDLESAYASCALRIRYNISTSDFPAWPDEAIPDNHQWTRNMVDARNNSKNINDESPNTPLYQDPYVYLGAGDGEDDEDHFVSLAVNTNQYARTFQDRSYTFKIVPRPGAAAAADDETDAPAVPAELADAASYPKIYNVNVRGKRGNIVQTYPAVEYDFTPNALALDEGDLVHFQWTGSDYNPRRGCNDAEGGPPDPNDFVTAANAASNSRADRSNVVFLNTMAENVPADSAGYSAADADDLTYDERLASTTAAYLGFAPCVEDDGSQSADEEAACVALMRRLMYLNQQSDGGALQLRAGNDCLTEDELDAISNKNERENHPLNCAKLNAKPFPYFDGGVMVARRPGTYAYFSSRNNNFSNRDQTGVVCVRGDGEACALDATTGVLQDANPMITVAPLPENPTLKQARARCFDEASQTGVANAQGAASCQSLDGTVVVLEDGTFAIENKDNDAIGDGNKDPCDVLIWNIFGSSDKKVTKYLRLAIALLFAGVIVTYFSYYGYNRYMAYRAKHRKFDTGGDWKNKKTTEMM